MKNSEHEVEESIKEVAAYAKKEISALKREAATHEHVRAEIAQLRREVLPQIDRIDEKLKQMRTADIDKDIEYLQMQIDDLKSKPIIDDFEENEEDIVDLRKTVEEESALRISLEKKMKELTIDVRAIASSMGRVKQLEDLDYGKILAVYKKDRNVEEEFQKKMDDEVTKIVAKELARFTLALDKKMPQLATKDDLARLENALIEKRQKHEMPPSLQTDSINMKITSLEQRLDELVAAMRDNRNSYVIE